MLRRAGWSVVPKGAARAWSTRPALVVACAIADAAVAVAPFGARVEVRAAEQLNEIPAASRAAAGAEYLYLRGLEQMRLADPGDAYVAVAPDRSVAASLFVSDARARDRLELDAPGIYPKLSSGDVLTEGVYCWPRWRRHGMTTFLLSQTARLLAAAGVDRALAVIDARNVPSLRTFARVGYVPTGVVRLGSYRLNRWSSTFVRDDALADRLWARVTAQAREKPPSRR